MSSGMTMADVIAVREKLMAIWEKALDVAAATGFWTDLRGCGNILDAHHATIREALVSGQFSGNTIKVLADWDAIKISEDSYRQLVEEDARARAPKPNGQSWWEILEVAPSASDKVVRDAYLAKAKQCHPDRVSGLAADIIGVAESMTKRLNEAYEEAERRPSHWKVED
jgi:DnaJ-domain-containing protein 1